MIMPANLLSFTCGILCYTVTFGAIYINTSKNGIEEGDTFEINCTVIPLTSVVEFLLDGVSKGSCTVPIPNFAPGTCSSGITQNINTNETTLTIATASISTHVGTWKCTHNAENAEIAVQVLSLVTVLTNNQYELPATIDASSSPNSEFKVFVPCGYPQPTVSWTLDTCDNSQTGIAVNSPTLTTNTSAGCTSPLVAYTSAIKASALASPTVKTCYIPKTTMTYSEKPSVMLQSPFTSQVQFPGEVSKQSKAIEERSEKVFNTTAPGHAVGSAVHGSVCGTIQKLVELTFTYLRARRWHFSNQYTLCGTVVYGIQIVLVSAVSDIVTIAIVVGVLVYYYGQIECITIFYLFLLTAAFSIVGVLIYMLILVFFGDKDLIHIHFKKKKENIKLSAHGMKPIKDNNICIYFKVKAIYASITLHIIENMKKHQVQPRPEICQLKKVLTCKMLIDDKKDSNDSNHRNATHTEYQACYLKCENEKKTITVLDGNHKQIEQWTISADSFKIADIEISNINQDDSTKNESANCDSTKDDSKPNNSSKDDSKQNDSSKDDSTENEQDDNTKDASAKNASTKDASAKDASTKDASAKDASTKDNKKLETTDEWIFWFREGDTLCEIEEHKRKTTENLRCKQTVLLICVIILPIAWLVMIVLMLKNCIKSCKEKNTAKTDLEMIEKLNKDQKESSEQQDKKQKS